MADSITLQEACELIVDCPHSTPNWTEKGIVVLRSQYIKRGRLDLSNPSYTDEEHYQQRTRRATPQAGDLVITREAPMGEVCEIPEGLKCCLGQRMVLLRADGSRMNRRFLLYALQSPAVQHEILVNDGTGSTVSNLRIPLLENLKIPAPPLTEQRAIATVLGTLDDKIEINQRMSETMESMAQALFKSWFVDFDPVRAKAEARDPGLPKRIADLFPDSFEDSEVGEIPRGWQARQLGDVCERIFSGGTPSTTVSDYWGGKLPWLSSGETRAKFIISTEQFITEKGVENSSTRFAPTGATVIASAGQGNTRGQTSMLMLDTYINQSVVALLADKTKTTDHHLFFDLDRRYDEFRRVSDGHSSRGSLTTKLLASLATVLPSRHVILAFDSIVDPIVQRITASLRETHLLSGLRDTLLPKLISGELRVRDAERIVGVHV